MDIVKDTGKLIEEKWQEAKNSQTVTLATGLLTEEAEKMVRTVWISGFITGFRSGLDDAERHLSEVFRKRREGDNG